MYLVVESKRDVGAKFKRPLQNRSEKRVVDGELDPGRVRDLGDGGDVGQLECWVGRRLDEHQAGVGFDCLRDRGWIGGIDKRSLDAEVREHLLKQSYRAAVNHVGDNHVIARLQGLPGTGSQMAAMPVAKHTAGGVSSSAPSADSRADTVGLAARE